MFHKRRHQRVKRRFSCEFITGEQRYRGIVVELSHGGLFVQTDATTPLGAEVELHLAGSGAVPNMTLRALVVRRRMVPAPLAVAVRRGIGLELLEAPREYGLACGSQLLEAPIRLARRGRGVGAPSDGPAPPLEGPAVQEPRAALRAPEKPFIPPAWAPREASHGDEEVRPDALVVDDGSLDDVEAILRELGADVTRVRLGEAGSEAALVRPRRLFVTSARLATSLPLPEADDEERSVAVAVAEDESHTLATMMRRMGFDFLVHRPTHPDALRLLLRQILYRGTEQRNARRLAFGAEVAWRSGWRRRRSPMLDLSTSGCRILAGRTTRVGARIRLVLPPEVTSERRIALRGRVVRRELRPGANDAVRYCLAIAFDAPSARMQKRLDALLARITRGPARLPRSPAAPPEARTPAVQARPSGLAAQAPALIGVAEAVSAARSERRRAPRARLDREIVALDESATCAVHALVGRDLSSAGMRIDPHPDLALHQRVRIALYDATLAAPLIIDAEVSRDEGAAGFALRFVDVAPEAALQIGHLVASLPAVESLRPEPHRAVLAELVHGRDAA